MPRPRCTDPGAPAAPAAPASSPVILWGPKTEFAASIWAGLGSKSISSSFVISDCPEGSTIPLATLATISLATLATIKREDNNNKERMRSSKPARPPRTRGVVFAVLLTLILLIGVNSDSPTPASAVWSDLVTTARSSLFGMFGFETAETEEGKGKPKPKSKPKSKENVEITSAEVRERVDLARELVKSGNVDDAIDILLRVLERNPVDSDAYEPNLMLGTALLTEKKLAQPATGFLYNAVQLSNWTATIPIVNLIAALSADNDTKLAERVALRGIDVGRDKQIQNTVFFLGQSLGQLLEERSDYTSASEWYLASALDNPAESDEPWIKASTMRFPVAQQNLDVCESVLLRAFPHHPNSAEILYHLAVALHKQDRVSQALPLYRRAAELDPKRPGMLAMFATALHSSNLIGEAIEIYKNAVQLTGENTNPVLLANFAMALCEPTVGEYAQGRQLVAAAAKLKGGGAANNDIEAANEMCSSSITTTATTTSTKGEL